MYGPAAATNSSPSAGSRAMTASRTSQGHGRAGALDECVPEAGVDRAWRSVTPMGTTGRSGYDCAGEADSDRQVGRGRGEVQASAVEHDIGDQAERLGRAACARPGGRRAPARLLARTSARWSPSPTGAEAESQGEVAGLLDASASAPGPRMGKSSWPASSSHSRLMSSGYLRDFRRAVSPVTAKLRQEELRR